jgi:hypothetical protein
MCDTSHGVHRKQYAKPFHLVKGLPGSIQGCCTLQCSQPRKKLTPREQKHWSMSCLQNQCRVQRTVPQVQFPSKVSKMQSQCRLALVPARQDSAMVQRASRCSATAHCRSCTAASLLQQQALDSPSTTSQMIWYPRHSRTLSSHHTHQHQ